MTPRTEWNDLISRSRNLVYAVATMALSAALLTVSMGVLFCSVFTTFFRVSRSLVDRTMTKIDVPELLRSGSSERAGCVDLTFSRSFPDDNVTAVREAIQRLQIGRRPSATPSPR